MECRTRDNGTRKDVEKIDAHSHSLSLLPKDRFPVVYRSSPSLTPFHTPYLPPGPGRGEDGRRNVTNRARNGPTRKGTNMKRRRTKVSNGWATVRSRASPSSHHLLTFSARHVPSLLLSSPSSAPEGRVSDPGYAPRDERNVRETDRSPLVVSRSPGSLLTPFGSRDRMRMDEQRKPNGSDKG